jgi:hypothetical protein
MAEAGGRYYVFRARPEQDEAGSGDKRQAPALFTVGANLDLDELRARVFLNTGTSGDKLERWYLDTDATHHMTGRRELFTNLDTSTRGTVRFGDESKVEIHGIGSIFEAKTGEHRVLHGVYYIPVLRNSIMSLGQLDKGGSKVEIEDGVLRIWDRRNRASGCSSRSAAALIASTSSTSTRPSRSASSRARMMRRGAGMSALAISTSTRFVSSPGTTWCAGYR